MHRLPLLLAVCLLLACGSPAPAPRPSPSPSQAVSCLGIPPVYHPSRLKTLGLCETYDGIVLASLHETDGDRHLWVAPDPGFQKLLNAQNVYHGQPALVAEISPACTLPPADAAAASRCPASKLPAPVVGEHVELRGPWVNDLVHGWDELHPVALVLRLPPASTAGMTFPTPGPSDTPDE